MMEIILRAIAQFEYETSTAGEQVDFAFFITVLHLFDFKMMLPPV